MDGVVARDALRGVFSALVTPMHGDERINYAALAEIVRLQIDDGAEGFYCCGSSGEGLLLSLDERKQVLETVVKAARGARPVIAHVGTVRTADVIELARHAMDSGADAVSMIPPYYYKFSTEEILGYYRQVLGAVPGLPVILYNIPQFTGVSFTKENAGELLALPSVIGIKHTSTDLYGLERMKQQFPDKIYYNGFDEIFLSGLAAGADAAVGTTINLYARTFVGIRDSFLAGDMARAARLQSLVNHRVEVTLRAGIFSAVKYGFGRRGIDCGPCRSPFKPLTAQDKKELDALFDEGFGCPAE